MRLVMLNHFTANTKLKENLTNITSNMLKCKILKITHMLSSERVLC